MKIRALKLLDRHYPPTFHAEHVDSRWNYQDFLDHPEWGKDWISFDGVVSHEGSNRIYCGLTRFDGEILTAWDRKAEKFIDVGFEKEMDRYDAKFHRSMELSGDSLYLATALLHDIDRYQEAPGGGIYRHDIPSGKTEKLGIPIPHNYIQSCALDEKRAVIYNMHFTPERLSAFELDGRKTRDLGPIGSGMQMAQGENIILDDQGCVWCAWGATKAWLSTEGSDVWRLCKYDPDAGRITYYNHGLPRHDGTHGFTKVEGLFNLGTGVLYASGGNGSLFRIEPQTARATYLGTPISDKPSRLTSLAMHSDGFAYGITGRNGECRLLRFDPNTDTFELGAPIADGEGNAMYQCHDVAITRDGTLYAGENDSPLRSSYLWEITL
ncbi:MAG: hypothetical protein K8R88_14575 [Armatimonadetes bacterium]|nr:hypothetical protein [Armatimonadota bacterium]